MNFINPEGTVMIDGDLDINPADHCAELTAPHIKTASLLMQACGFAYRTKLAEGDTLESAYAQSEIILTQPDRISVLAELILNADSKNSSRLKIGAVQIPAQLAHWQSVNPDSLIPVDKLVRNVGIKILQQHIGE